MMKPAQQITDKELMQISKALRLKSLIIWALAIAMVGSTPSKGTFRSAMRIQQPPADALKKEADRLFQKVLAMNVSQMNAMRDLLKRAMALYGEAGDLDGQINCSILLGIVNIDQGKHQTAEDLLNESLDLAKGKGDPIGRWIARSFLAQLKTRKGKHAVAQAHYRIALSELTDLQQATVPPPLGRLRVFSQFFRLPFDYLDLALQTGNGPLPMERVPVLHCLLESLTRKYLGEALADQGIFLGAEEHLEQALQRSRSCSGLVDHQVLKGLARIRRLQGRLDDARRLYRESVQACPPQLIPAKVEILEELQKLELAQYEFQAALRLNEEIKHLVKGLATRQEEALQLSARARVFLRQKRLDEAEKALQEARRIAAESNDPYSNAVVLRDLGYLAISRGKLEESAALLETARERFRVAGFRYDELVVSLCLADSFISLGRYELAMSLAHEAQKLANELSFTPAEAKLALIREMKQLGINPPINSETAGNMFMRIFQDMVSHSPIEAQQGLGLFVQGLVQLRNGETLKAREFLLKAQPLVHQLGHSELSAMINLALGLAEWEGGDYLKGAVAFSAALDEFESSTVSNFRLPDYLISFLGLSPGALPNRQISYALAVEMLAMTDQVQRSFLYSEKARARALLMRIARSMSGIVENSQNEGVSGDLIERISALQKRRSASDSIQARKKLKNAKLRLQLFNRQKALTDAPPLEAESIQRGFLDEKTTLIAYFVSPRRVFAWVLDQENLVKINLTISPLRLEKLVGQWKLHASNCLRVPDSRCSQAEDYSRRLYSKLIGPLIPYIRHRHLIFIPHRELHHLSFAALMNSGGRYLIEDFVVSTAASASILPLLSKRSGKAGTDLLVAGNPVAKGLPSLWAAEKEALAAARILSANPLLGMQATESAVRKRAKAGKLALLHLAAFGHYEKKTPQFSGVALTPDEHNDGNWEVHEIMDEADLRGVRLVVLTACWAAAGEPTGGDDVISLTRAFLAVGSPAVLSTLWAFNDDFPAAEFITHFYEGWLAGSTAAEALRLAQLALLQEEKYRPPYFWAGYTLHGDPQSGWQ